MSEGDGALAWRSPRVGQNPQQNAAAVFVDRDGVLNERPDDGFVLSWDEFRWRPDAFGAIKALAAKGLPVIVVSNQSCIGRGLLRTETLVDIMARMTDALEQERAPIAAWYCCPHAPDAGCDCRKPKPGMLRRGARELGIDLARSHMIGDTETDVAAGAAAGCTTHLIDPSKPNAFLEVAQRIGRAGP